MAYNQNGNYLQGLILTHLAMISLRAKLRTLDAPKDDIDAAHWQVSETRYAILRDVNKIHPEAVGREVANEIMDIVHEWGVVESGSTSYAEFDNNFVIPFINKYTA